MLGEGAVYVDCSRVGLGVAWGSPHLHLGNEKKVLSGPQLEGKRC